MLETEPVYVKKEDGSQECIAPNPYLWISQDNGSIYYQNGNFYKGKGEEPVSYDEVPDWFWNIIRTNYLDSDNGKKLVERLNLVLPEKRVLTKEEREADAVRKTTQLWKCEEEGCGKEVPYSSRNFHIATHRRLEKIEKRKSGDKHDKSRIEQAK
jgi:hypothetical protein